MKFFSQPEPIEEEKAAKKEKEEEEIVEFFSREEIEEQKQKFRQVSPQLKILKIFFCFVL